MNKKHKSIQGDGMIQLHIYAVPKGGFHHKILAIGGGWATHNCPERNIVVEFLHDALAGKEYVLERSIWSALPAEVLINRALELSQKRRYSLAYNCEDYIEELLGNDPRSVQRNACIALLGMGAVLMIASRL